MPDVSELMLPTQQGYSDGSIVAWDQAGGHDAERPAPVLAIGAADSGDAVDGLTLTATVLGALGLIAGLVALVLALRMRRSAR